MNVIILGLETYKYHFYGKNGNLFTSNRYILNHYSNSLQYWQYC